MPADPLLFRGMRLRVGGGGTPDHQGDRDQSGVAPAVSRRAGGHPQARLRRLVRGYGLPATAPNCEGPPWGGPSIIETGIRPESEPQLTRPRPRPRQGSSSPILIPAYDNETLDHLLSGC